MYVPAWNATLDAARRETTRGRPTIVTDPAIMGGAPCIAGTRVPAAAVAVAVAMGDGVAGVAADYDLTRGEVLLACWWIVTVRRWTGLTPRDQRDIVGSWGYWAGDVHGSFAGREGAWGLDDIPDPPEVWRP